MSHPRIALSIAPILAAVALLNVVSVRAATLTLEYDHSFGSVMADGSAPWLTAVFDDGGSPGTVSLTLTVANTIDEADITALYFNLDPILDLNDLTLTRTGGSGPAGNKISVSTGINSYKADGDGWYDIFIDLPPPPGSDGHRFNAGENLMFDINGIPVLTANSFNFFSLDSGGAGPFIAAAKVQETGPSPFEGSDWIAPSLVTTPVPIPAAVWLFVSALGVLGWRRRRAN